MQEFIATINEGDRAFILGDRVVILSADEVASARTPGKRGVIGTDEVIAWIDAGARVTTTAQVTKAALTDQEVFAKVGYRTRTKNGIGSQVRTVQVLVGHLRAIGAGRGTRTDVQVASAALMALAAATAIKANDGTDWEHHVGDTSYACIPVSIERVDGGHAARDVAVGADGSIVVGDWNGRSARQIKAEADAALLAASRAQTEALASAAATMDAATIAALPEALRVALGFQ